ncbi:transmembrane sensor [Achromobacter insolitus]|uniref:FecR family protein n=1 Tax=Achromobacter insolitus TaxID=217204 RepID=UPI0007C6C526|nr:FecR family protein [Achromobacter insolitus]OAE61440.1 transmembrane sensor [Achromobacter insolitus]OCZ59417.1 transmembrane sensor [Achromobacter insolitus]
MPRTDAREDASRPPATTRDQAAHWFSRERLGALDDAQRRALEAWLAADPEHARQYRAMQALWRVADRLPEDEMRAILARSDEAPARPGRRTFAVGLSAACAFTLAAGVIAPRLWSPAPDFTQSLATARGERKRVALPDGSLVELNTDTQIQVALYEDRREIELLAGEALFTVSPDAARHFTVNAGAVQVRVTGTRFNVRRDGDVVALAVDEGSVAFSAGAWWNKTTRHLTAGYAAQYAPGAPLAAPHQENVAAVTAWQRGRLVFRDTPLAQVVAELNRYLRSPLRIDDRKLAQLRVAGTLPIEEPESVLDVLPHIAPVIVLYAADGGAVLAPR